jgi:hypothetical protein
MCDVKPVSLARRFNKATAVLVAVVALSTSLNSTLGSVIEDQVPPVYLNHLFVVLDPATYEALSSSDFIRNGFAGFEQRTTQAGSGESWSGTYLYGESTYIEIFKASEEAMFTEGNAGIGFCVEQAGGIEAVVRALDINLESAEVSYYPRTMMTEDKGEVPWFQVAQPEYKEGEAQNRLTTWVMEYHPGYLNTIDPHTYPVPGDISRKEYLKRFFIPDRYLRDIVAVNLVLNTERAESLSSELQAFGWKINTGEGTMICEGPGITIKVSVGEDSNPVITEIEFSLQKVKEGQRVYDFGEGAELEFGEGPSAVMRFK